MDFFNVIFFAGIAGFFSSVLGGILAITIKKPSKTFIGLSFIFASAVLLALVFVDFIPHAIGHGHYHTGIDDYGDLYQYWYQHSGGGIWITIFGICVGSLLIYLLGKFDKHGHEHIHGIMPHNEYCSHTGLLQSEKKRIVATAFPVIFAIVLHDFPKGLAIGSASSVLAAIAIGLSCIPEGMSIALPLKTSGMRNIKILGICSIAGFATVLGAIIGYLLGGINPYISGFMFSVAAGCIIAVVFNEMIPIAVEYSGKSKAKLVVSLAGVLIVVAMNYFFHDLMH
ncbi:MAG: ZIP family metal transporter [Defluviitaleaceae bacterium]|nr:ZIP family metal transporter [Defluviitaleaceae bacterium]